MSLRDNFHALCKTRGLDASGHIGDWSSDFEYDHSHIQIMWEGFQAGAASRDAEVAELVEALQYLAEAILTKADADYTRRQMDEAVRVMELHGITMPVPYALAKVRKP